MASYLCTTFNGVFDVAWQMDGFLQHAVFRREDIFAHRVSSTPGVGEGVIAQLAVPARVPSVTLQVLPRGVRETGITSEVFRRMRQADATGELGRPKISFHGVRVRIITPLSVSKHIP